MYIASYCTTNLQDKVCVMDIGQDVTVSVARANITEVINRVRLLRWCVLLTNRAKPVAAVVPPELGQLIRRAGGPDTVAGILRERLGEPATDE
jgi:prevent-host-death family protein